MIVTFISQCEKKAIKRTRKILDAFANRIGDNVWQTNITEIGLKTVYELLKSTASKSTAVACHRIATRHRTELVWVVGNKSAFNHQGYVPVNRTSMELFMDIAVNQTFFANSHGQLLSHHLFAVGFIAYHLIKKLEIDDDRLAQSAFIAGILHDMGKLDPQFQTWLAKKLNKTDEEIYLSDDGVHINGSDKGFAKFNFENHPRHHELSWILALSLLRENNTLNSSQKEQIAHGIYWHHTRPYRTKNEKFFESSQGIDKLWQETLQTSDNMPTKVSNVLKDIQQIAKHFNDGTELLIPFWQYQCECVNSSTPNYKNYSDISNNIKDFVNEIRPNALNNLVRMAVICADRWVSALSADDLQEYINEGSLIRLLDDKDIGELSDNNVLRQGIAQCLNNFEQKYPNSERNIAQSQIAKALAELKDDAEFANADNIAVLQGPAGCGKTKIALEWALNTHAKQIIWVCPRVQVCLGLLHDLTQADYLPDCQIEIFTGEYKKIIGQGVDFDNTDDTLPQDYFSGDIVIATIDQVVNNIISHQKVVGLFDFMNAHIVFDEFHEIINIPALNLLFAELIEAKKLRKANANVLLVSATPHDYFVKNVLGIDENYIVRMPSFNTSQYELQFISFDETEQKSPLVLDKVDKTKTAFVISNTAQDAQLGFLLHQQDENAILLHSKYTRQDKKAYFDKVLDSFKQNGSGKYDLLRSGPIVQASLNISCERMFSDFTNAENYLQRLGRLNRFGENDQISIYTVVYPKSFDNKKQSSSQAKFLASLNSWQSSLAWYEFLTNYLSIHHIKHIGLNQLYEIYQAFYQDKDSVQKIQDDIEKSLKQSRDIINKKVIDPMSTPTRAKQKDSMMKIASTSLRGDNRFVQMAVCEVDNQLNPTFIDEYAYDENTNHCEMIVGLTESVDRIQGGRFEMRDEDKNLVEFMRKKHHNIMAEKYPNETFKQAKNAWELLKLARSPEFPIYLSYTEQDLAVVGGDKARHPFAIYYIKTAKQAVGMMPVDRLQNPTQVGDDE